MYRRQLGASGNQFARVRLLLLGHSGVGKSTLVESLKCGYIRSLFRRSGATLQGTIHYCVLHNKVAADLLQQLLQVLTSFAIFVQH